uniref:Protein FAM32A n=1 Tax=Strongyloides papillosus TaxID=174720 RepID=A0A0N5B7Q9_STREA
MKPEGVVKGTLKLKGGNLLTKKKPQTEEVKKVEKVIKKDSKIIKKTPAQIAFEKKQEQIKEKKLREKAALSYKDKVNKLNEKLENLSEFNDIPKVSWTK